MVGDYIKKIYKGIKPYCTWKMLPIVATMYFFTNGMVCFARYTTIPPMVGKGMLMAMCITLYGQKQP